MAVRLKPFAPHKAGSAGSADHDAILGCDTPLRRLLEAEKVGVVLSDEFLLHPEQSTGAIVLHHPQAKYFSI